MRHLKMKKRKATRAKTDGMMMAASNLFDHTGRPSEAGTVVAVAVSLLLLTAGGVAELSEYPIGRGVGTAAPEGSIQVPPRNLEKADCPCNASEVGLSSEIVNEYGLDRYRTRSASKHEDVAE